jgi:prephenate dehydratase
MMSPLADNTIAYQGVPGAYSNLACKARFPDMKALANSSFEDMLMAVTEGRAKYAMVPVENSVAGRVADIHHLLPSSKLYIIGEYFQQVNHQLLGVKGARIADLKEIHSHAQGLAQCRNMLNELRLMPMIHSDTAGAARDIAAKGDKSVGAIASVLAAEIYGLDVLKANAEDFEHNTTRMLIMARDQVVPPKDQKPVITTLIFRLRSVPAALYKALGGFATNGINLTKLESYMAGGTFSAAQFYIDAECHQDSAAFSNALDELKFYTSDGSIQILGCYEADMSRRLTDDS